MTKPILEQTRDAIAIYCDDVRAETGNKISLMGIYQNDLVVRQLPVKLPKLCAMITVRTPVSDPFEELKFELLADGKVAASTTVNKIPEISITNEERMALMQSEPRIQAAISMRAILQLVPFEIPEPCMLRARVTTESAVIYAGALKIREEDT